jgi:pimeloyl-ACP methyl ester carboxylesterase
VSRAMHLKLRTMVGVLTVIAAFLAFAASPAGAAAGQSVVDLPVSFAVHNTNTSLDPCYSDGADYTVKGHISAPQGSLATGHGDVITVYLYGYEGGEWNWHLRSVAGYDHAAEMAKLGHVSLTIDEVGYGASGRPQDGNLTCQGAEADVTHQIVQMLRHGTYTLGSGRGVDFKTIVLAGHDVGAQVADIEAYSYSDIDGLVDVTFAEQGFTPWIIERSAVAANDWCTTSPTGYVHYVSAEEWRTLLFYDADPRVVNATEALRNANPCGIVRSTPPAVASEKGLDSQIKVPVLVVFGDKTTVFIPNAGHFVMFEKTAWRLRSAVSDWLESRFH